MGRPPGFDQSPALPGDVTVATLTDAVGSSMGARMSLEMARRGHSGDVVALDPVAFWTDRQVKVFGATVGPSIALAATSHTGTSPRRPCA